MSKFIDAVKADLLWTRRPERWPNELMTKVDFDVRPQFMVFEEHRDFCIGVTWEMTGHCRPNELGHMKRLAIEKLREQIYGEFAVKLRDLEIAIYQHKADEAMELVRELRKEVAGSTEEVPC